MPKRKKKKILQLTNNTGQWTLENLCSHFKQSSIDFQKPHFTWMLSCKWTQLPVSRWKRHALRHENKPLVNAASVNLVFRATWRAAHPVRVRAPARRATPTDHAAHWCRTLTSSPCSAHIDPHCSPQLTAVDLRLIVQRSELWFQVTATLHELIPFSRNNLLGRKRAGTGADKNYAIHHSLGGALGLVSQ